MLLLCLAAAREVHYFCVRWSVLPFEFTAKYKSPVPFSIQVWFHVEQDFDTHASEQICQGSRSVIVVHFLAASQ